MHINPCAADGLFGKFKIMQRKLEMTETMANGYSSGSTQRELSNEYQREMV